jgi:hypothetical protein
MIDNWFNQFEYLGITFYPTTARGQTIKVYIEINNGNPFFTFDGLSKYIEKCLHDESWFNVDFSECLSIAHVSKVRRVIIPADVLKTTFISFSYE